jgi:signal transduction histidine kinase
MFIRPILQMKERSPKIDIVMLLIFGLYILILITIGLGYKVLAYNLIDLGALTGAFTILIAATVISLQGYRPAKFILVSWTMFLISVIVFVLKDFDLVPYNTFTNYSLLLGSGLETVLLSFALADRINSLKIEKEQSQAETIEALQVNEKLVRDQNSVLELRVEERTESLSLALKDLKEAQTQLVESEKMATLGQLTAGIAHEINNPINFVISNVQPLRQDFGDIKEVLAHFEDAAQNQWDASKAQKVNRLIQDIDLDYVLQEINLLLNGIDEGAKRTSEIVLGLRNFSRLDERSMKKALISECLDSTLILLNSIVKSKIDIVKVYADLPEIDCQPGKINQVFMNILTNAIQALEEYKVPEPQIRIQTKDHDTEIMISISDNGPGMSEDVKNHIFEPFFSTKDVGKGTGLGLSIVHGIIKSHNGKIEVETALGKGTTFFIWLPKIQP